MKENEILRPGTTQPFANITPGLVAAAGPGQIAVYDDATGQVLLLTRSGTSLGAIGRRGRGPGEFLAPSGLGVSRDGTLAVFDVAKASVVRFDLMGRTLPEIRVTAMHEGGPLLVTSHGLTLGVVEIDRRARIIHHKLLSVPDSGQLRALTAVDEPLPLATRFPGCANPIVLAPAFAPRLRWAAMGDTIVAATRSDYTLEYFPAGQLPFRAGRPIRPLRATRGLALASIPSRPLAQKVGACAVSPEKMLEASGYSETVPEIDRLAVAPDGDVWVRRGEARPDGGALDILSIDGMYIGTLPAGFPFPTAFLDSITYVSVEPDSDEINHLVVYRVAH